MLQVCDEQMIHGKKMKATNTYSALMPTCNIRICLTIVLFPDSPAPESKKRSQRSVGKSFTKVSKAMTKISCMTINLKAVEDGSKLVSAYWIQGA